MANSFELNELTALSPAERSDGLVLPVTGVGFYEFREASTATASELLIVEPDSGTGRWHQVSMMSNIFASLPSPLTDDNTVAVNARVTSTFTLAMSASRAARLIAAPTGLLDGHDVRIWLVQPSTPPTGGCKITLATIWQPRQGVIDLNPAANSISLLQGQYIASIGKILCEVGPW
jgi:hypothetical protein